MFFVGVDWADQKHDALVIDTSAKQLLETTFEHNLDGCEKLDSQLQKISPNREDFACIIETNNGLLVQFLLEKGYPVYPVNPKAVDGRRKPSGAKTDRIDAMILAKYGRAEFEDLRRLKPDSELVRKLKILTRDQDLLIADMTRLTNRLIACLKDYYPVATTLFTQVNSPITISFLKAFPTLHHARLIGVPELAQFLKEHKHPKPSQTAIAIYDKVQSPQLEADEALVECKSRLMRALVTQIEVLLEETKSYDKEITRLFKSHSDSKIFASIPKAGERLAPRLLAEWGDDRERYECVAAVQAIAGSSPVLFQSGKYRYAQQRQACNKHLRRVLYLLAFQSIGPNGSHWAREYYSKKRKEGKRNSEALRQLSNIWVRIIYAMWMNQTRYYEETFLTAQSRHQKAA